MDADDLSSIADELYSSPIDTFTPSRNAHASAAARRGDDTLASDIRALRKPTAAAWAANLLVRRSPAALAALTELRQRIEAITATGDREELRTATRDRHELVSQLVDHARTIVTDAGRPLSGPAAEELGDALLAALGDPEVSAALATGRLVSAPRTGGMSSSEIRGTVALPPAELAFAGQDLADLEEPEAPDSDQSRGDRASSCRTARRRGASTLAGESPSGGSTDTGRATSAGAQRRRLERELAAAEKAEADAHADRARREAERHDSARRRDELGADLARKQEAVRRAERELDDAEDAVTALTADIRSRELEWKRAEAAVRRLRRQLDEQTHSPGS